MTLGKLLYFFEPQFPSLKNGKQSQNHHEDSTRQRTTVFGTVPGTAAPTYPHGCNQHFQRMTAEDKFQTLQQVLSTTSRAREPDFHSTLHEPQTFLWTWGALEGSGPHGEGSLLQPSSPNLAS